MSERQKLEGKKEGKKVKKSEKGENQKLAKQKEKQLKWLKQREKENAAKQKERYKKLAKLKQKERPEVVEETTAVKLGTKLTPDLFIGQQRDAKRVNSVDAKTKPEFRAILICDVGDEVTLKHYFPWTIRNRRVMFAEDTIQVDQIKKNVNWIVKQIEGGNTPILIAQRECMRESFDTYEIAFHLTESFSAKVIALAAFVKLTGQALKDGIKILRKSKDWNMSVPKLSSPSLRADPSIDKLIALTEFARLVEEQNDIRKKERKKRKRQEGEAPEEEEAKKKRKPQPEEEASELGDEGTPSDLMELERAWNEAKGAEQEGKVSENAQQMEEETPTEAQPETEPQEQPESSLLGFPELPILDTRKLYFIDSAGVLYELLTEDDFAEEIRIPFAFEEQFQELEEEGRPEMSTTVGISILEPPSDTEAAPEAEGAGRSAEQKEQAESRTIDVEVFGDPIEAFKRRQKEERKMKKLDLRNAVEAVKLRKKEVQRELNNLKEEYREKRETLRIRKIVLKTMKKQKGKDFREFKEAQQRELNDIYTIPS